MKTVTVRLPVQIAAEIANESRARRISKSDVVRERLTAPRAVADTSPSFDAIADLVGSVDGLPAGLSAHRKRYLKNTRYGKKRAG